MSTFLADLLHDLREKRLLPVALVLAVAIAAVPIVLARGSSGGSAGSPGSVAQRPSAAASAQKEIATLVQSGDRGVSDLGKYGSKNPFKPPSGFAGKPAQAGTATGSAIASGSPGTGSSGSPGKGSSGGSASPGSSGSAPAVTSPPVTSPPARVRRRAYAYVADLTFTANGRTRRIRGARRLRMLPSSSSPLLLFLGVTQSGGDAVFLVDSSLRAAGEGRCSPSPSQCATVAIGAGAEHEFTTAAGDSYTLRVDEIRKVALRSGKASAAGATASRRRARAASAGPVRRFSLPVLVDLVSGPDTTAARSSARRGGR